MTRIAYGFREIVIKSLLHQSSEISPLEVFLFNPYGKISLFAFRVSTEFGKVFGNFISIRVWKSLEQKFWAYS